MIIIKLDFELPTYNEQMNTARSNKYASASMKKKFDRKILHQILTQINQIPHYNSIKLNIIWIESKKKRDPDNVHAGIKFICDAIKKSGIIDDDDRDHIKGISHSIEIFENRGVIIEISEV